MLYFGSMKSIVFISCFIAGALPAFAQMPDADIWLFDIKDSAGQISFHNPTNITNRKGYDNQPAFSPDGKYILYTSQQAANGSTDIYKYDLATKRSTPFTNTPESEYSPTFMPDGKGISVVRVEKDSTQRVWKFLFDGSAPTLVMDKIDSVGYHAWIGKDSMAVFILTKPAFTLQVLSIRQQKPVVVADSIGRCIKVQNGIVWFTTKAGYFKNVCWYQPHARNAFIKGMIESEDFCFYGKNALWSISDGSIIAGFLNNKDGAPEVVDLTRFGIKNPARPAISPDGKKLAVVSVQ